MFRKMNIDIRKEENIDLTEEIVNLYNTNPLTIEFGVTNDCSRQRGFEVVGDEFRKTKEDIQLPIRADNRSAAYDFRTPTAVEIKPNEKILIWSDVKAYMQDDEVLQLYVRSSIGLKKGLVLANTVGIIDSSYYSNKDNDGNIGICLLNTSDKTVYLEAQERVCQGIFTKYLITDDDIVLKENRTGGFGSSGRVE